MTTLKAKIINALQNDEPLNPVINAAEESQENLLKNHSNKILDKNQKNIILTKFSDLKEFIQSLFRYNTLKENGYTKDAQEEKETLENMVLQGYISNTKYVWHAESGKNTCEECKALDGQEFDFYGELPETPHPNCKCVLEVVEDSNIVDNKESIDNTSNYFDEFITKLDNLIQKALLLKNEILYTINQYKTLYASIPKNLTYYILYLYIESLEQILGAVDDFIVNYQDMKAANTKNADKYFHSKANCEAAQRGFLGAIIAAAISDLRELTDSFRNTKEKGMSIIDSLKDSFEDQGANWFGRIQGIKNPNNDSKILINKYRPNGLPEKY